MHACISRGMYCNFFVQLEEIEVIEYLMIIHNLIIALVSLSHLSLSLVLKTNRPLLWRSLCIVGSQCTLVTHGPLFSELTLVILQILIQPIPVPPLILINDYN